MARIYQDVCTIHLERDEIVTIAGDELFGYNGDWYTFGACKECKETINQLEFEQLVIDHGVKMKDGELPPGMKVKKPKATKATAAKTATPAPAPTQDDADGEPCLYCKFVSKSEAGHNQHVRAVHNFMGVRDSYGTTCPLDGAEVGLLAQHTKGAHGLTLARTFEKAKRDGDKFGVVADALARLKA